MSEGAAGEAFQRFVELVARLRGPGGCPWDREQTHESLKPMTIEEAYEVVEAIDHGDPELKGELGDLLLQVVFHAQIAAEQRRFDVAGVIAGVSDKLVRRHPHVFGADPASTAGEVLRNWEALKRAEREESGKAAPGESMLDAVSRALPAVMEAFQIGTKVARVGFDWPDPGAVLGKLDEEVAELKHAMARSPRDTRAVAEELGDLLFVAVNLARVLGADPESALKAANRKFRRRFAAVEQSLRASGRAPADAAPGELDRLWDQAKRREQDGG